MGGRVTQTLYACHFYISPLANKRILVGRGVAQTWALPFFCALCVENRHACDSFVSLILLVYSNVTRFLIILPRIGENSLSLSLSLSLYRGT